MEDLKIDPGKENDQWIDKKGGQFHQDPTCTVGDHGAPAFALAVAAVGRVEEKEEQQWDDGKTDPYQQCQFEVFLYEFNGSRSVQTSSMYR